MKNSPDISNRLKMFREKELKSISRPALAEILSDTKKGIIFSPQNIEQWESGHTIPALFLQSFFQHFPHDFIWLLTGSRNYTIIEGSDRNPIQDPRHRADYEEILKILKNNPEACEAIVKLLKSFKHT